MATNNPPRLHRRALTAGLVPAVAAALLLGGCGGSSPGTAAAQEGGAATGKAGAGERAGAGKVPEATTYTTVRGAPEDSSPDGATDGLVVNPAKAVPVHDRPDGRVIATLPAKQLDGPTWVPVVETSGDWRRVLLPSRPNRSTGWISGKGMRTARTPYTIRVDLGARTLTLLRSMREVGRWKVAIGGPQTPTPTGRTFVLATLTRDKKAPSRIVLPLGTHSATLDSFGGGPGTVALHGWPDASVFGRAVSHGCVRVPDAALKALSRVPLGSLVFING
ncbi:murein L,D-transpeptidase [Actinomadura sp. GC306]|uniref:L,D-transpeptidase n=1 Tax=Actinomadura sp. GC306 TaxID=2530367 RepID=UPI0010440350|nr:L,D-transpeptidase [Actinomadura sp. GC306]TDC68007.1 murein L,D-transpeptidase [Actinomadura sp. GC306]